MPVQPRAALRVVFGEHEPDRLITAAFTEEPVLMAVCRRTRYCGSRQPELGIERLASSAVWGVMPSCAGYRR
jgi:hypothetical protein